MKTTNQLSILLLSLLFLVHCASQSRVQDNYYDELNKTTENIKDYSGLYNTLQVTATLLTQDVLHSRLEFERDVFALTDDQYNQKRIMINELSSKESKVFISIYTPNVRDSKLKKKNNPWNIYLTVNGKDYVPKIKKVKKSLKEIQRFYPYHNRWSEPYMLSFDLPTEELQSSELVVSGPDAQVTLNFN